MAALRPTTPPAAVPAPAPVLVPVGSHKGQQPLPLNRPLTVIGSSASARLYLPSKAVSRCHAAVVNTGAGLFVRDLASRTGTRVNGQVVNEADLREGDVLEVGPFSFRFTDPTAPKARPPALPAPAAVLEVDELDAPLPVAGRTTLIGRRETADVSLVENAASSAHALLFVVDGKHLLRDLNSRTGTWVNGVNVHEHTLQPGDVLRVGETTFRYARVGGGPSPAADAAEGATPAGAAGGAKGEEKYDVDVTATEVAPLIESGPAELPAARADAEAPLREANGAPVDLLDAGEPSPAPNPRGLGAGGDADADEIPLAPLEERRD